MWLLVLLPAILAVVRELTDASRIVFLIFWIIGMFGIATALIFTAYADHDLKKTLEELKELVPPEEEIEHGSCRFPVTEGAALPKEAERMGLDMESTIDYDFEDAKDYASVYVEDFYAALVE